MRFGTHISEWKTKLWWNINFARPNYIILKMTRKIVLCTSFLYRRCCCSCCYYCSYWCAGRRFLPLIYERWTYTNRYIPSELIQVKIIYGCRKHCLQMCCWMDFFTPFQKRIMKMSSNKPVYMLIFSYYFLFPTNFNSILANFHKFTSKPYLNRRLPFSQSISCVF